jgi:hypothetical protein
MEAATRMIDEAIQILKIEQDSHDGLIVNFSDGTTAGYVVEELLMLRPNRERASDYFEPQRPSAIEIDRLSIGTLCSA